ncbi:DUF2934 domain-containing protein [Rhodoferax sp. 4810]|nr:DUF2934 domain-containing protein [Rhodoferax jenense]
MATTPKKPSAAPVAAKPAAKKAVAASAVATKEAAPKAPAVKKVAAKKASPVAAPVVAPAAAPVAAPVAAAPAAKPAAKKTSAPKTKMLPSTAPTPVFSAEQRNHYVSIAAFYIAERRGFTLGNPVDDWLAAEAEVDRLLASGHFTA